ncbi:MAG: tRNA pseudouridine(13) synthase TruD [Planctomycetes bacterium]|nr:tRNA pseudouridine(13) synthase TruD [Planctomycetota bacterium]
MLTADGLAYLTHDEPGIGGRIKVRPEDFVVTEKPLYPCSGKGEHLYLYIEKRRRLTTDVVRYLSQHFKVSWDAIGYAGLKDKHAVTRQWFSVHFGKEERAADFHDDFIRILEVDRHTNKLKRGHLKGNHFEIKIREVDGSSVIRAKRILDRVARCGAPNFIGEQRFGYRKDTHLQGRALLKGDLQEFLDQMLGRPMGTEPEQNQQARRAYEAKEYARALSLWPTVHRFERQALGPLSRKAGVFHAVNCIDYPHRQLMISAFQSAIFNQLLNDRLKADRLDTLQVGDLAFKHDSRGVFEVKNVEAEQPRCDRLEISPTGAMWGAEMMRAGGEVGERERAALLETGVTEEDLAEGDYTAYGTRRAMRMPITDPLVTGGADDMGPYVSASFELPRGCFATVVIREITKDQPLNDEE